MMGRRRESNLELPPRMHIKSGRYYYVTSTVPRKWIPIGKTLKEAKRRWAEIETGEIDSVSLVDLIDEWLDGSAFAELSDNTRRQYLSVSKQLKSVFGEFRSVSDIKPHHVAQWQDNHHSKVNANTGRSILVNVLNVAVRRGLIERNPANEVGNLTIKRRGRYLTDQEFLAIRKHAHATLVAAMDIAYCTSLRISDILALQLNNISEDGIIVRQIKTKKLQMFKWNEALEAVIQSAKDTRGPIRSMYLLSNSKGQKMPYNQINEWWREARGKAGIVDVKFHDIRGKSATDAKRAGIDYQALLGHTTKAMSDSYIKLEDAQIVEPNKRML